MVQSGQKLGIEVTASDLASMFGGDMEAAAYFAGAAEWARFDARETVTRQFHKADYIYVLVEGGATFGVHIDDSGMLVYVGDSDAPWTPVGWSGLHAPGRYSTTVHASVPSRFIRWPTADLWRLLYSDPRRAASFLEALAGGGLSLLEAMREGIRAFGQGDPRGSALAAVTDAAETGARAGIMYDGTREEASAILAASPFFREFTGDEIGFFTRAARFVRVRGGERVMVQGAEPDGLYVLARGRVGLRFQPPGSSDLVTRSIGRDGTVFNLCGVKRPLASPFTVTATRDTVLLYIPADIIAAEAKRNPEFGFVYAQRALWLLGQFMLSARTRLVSRQAENETLAVASLIDQKSTEIPVRSDLYKIPHLLRDPNTRQDAFTTLHRLVTGGTPLERSLAGLQLDILTDLERETRFRDKLSFIYEKVAGAPHGASRAALLQESSEAMQHAFEEVPYVVDGLENLPAEAGSVVVYNHLACNRQYRLPNNFEFTLDSHFVSSLLLRHYGTPGLRVVKLSESNEFWHRGYYGRILNIGVSANESRTQRARFYQTVQNTLAAHTPVVIAPEGTNDTGSNWTETSPGPLRPGAFVLAMRMKPEPWVVPIALANFDRSVKNCVFAAVVRPPFRMSDYVADPEDREAVSRFLEDYRATMRSYVAEAQALAADAQSGRPLRGGLVSNLGRLDRLDAEFSGDVHQLEARVRAISVPPRPVVFYGSSSFRLWENVGAELGLAGALNLGFGGSTLEACAHFFERLVVPHRPSALFLYAGDNDIGNGALAEEVVEHFRGILYKADLHLPGVPLHVLSIKPSPFRQHQIDEIVRANRGIAQLCAQRPDTHFIDIFSSMLRPDGAPDASLFTEDMLHMNGAGYARWTGVLRRTAEAMAVAA